MRSRFAQTLFTGALLLISTGFAYSQIAYRDSENGVSLSLRSGWSWTGPNRWTDEKGAKSILILREAGSPQELRLWVQVLDPPEEITPAAKMDKRLLKQAQSKVKQRISEGYENYHLRAGSPHLHPINGRSALSWIADYTDHGRSMVEYLTRLRSENTNALFYARIPAEQLHDFKARVDPIIETLQIR
jgi:hypothetical protein